MNYTIYVDGFKIETVKWPANILSLSNYVYGWSIDRGISMSGVRAVAR